MNDRDKYFTRNPNHPVPEMSASDYLGIPYNAEFEAWYESDFKSSGYTVPFLRYEGPGNSTNLGEPKTYADYISKLHDLRYAYASYMAKTKQIDKKTFDERISLADSEFVSEQSWYPDGIIGKVGIGGKMAFENVLSWFGADEHQYPGNPEEENFSSGIDDNIDVVPMAEKVKAPYFTDRKNNPITARQWQHKIHTAAGNKFRHLPRNQWDEKKKEFIRAQHEAKLKEMGDDYWKEFKPNHIQFNLSKERNLPSTSAQSTTKPQPEQAEKRSATEDNSEATQSKQSKEVNEQENSEASAEQNQEAGEQMRSNQVEPMEVDKQATGANVNSSMGGTGISPAAGQIYSSKGFYQTKDGNMCYDNHFRVRGFGNAYFLCCSPPEALSKLGRMSYIL